MKQYAYLSGFSYPYFKKALVVSLSLHISILLLIIIAPFLPFLSARKNVHPYSTTIRVDLVGLPEKVIPEVDKNIVSTQEAIKELVKKTEAAHEDSQAHRFRTKKEKENLKKDQAAALARLKALRDLEQKQRKGKKEVLKKGNVLTSGVDLPAPGQEVGISEYEIQVQERIKLRWALPSYLRKQEQLIGKLVIFLDREGAIIRKNIISSGSSEFDAFMNKALEEALPFPPPPRDLMRDVRYDGIEIAFTAGELK